MDTHADFVAARRASLVDEFGGGPVAEAAVDRALARCRRGWSRLEREDDVEVRIRDAVAFELDRPRRRRIGLRTAGVLLVVVPACVLWSLRPGPPAVTEEQNPLPVPWYDGTQLHLAEVTVTLPDLGPFVPDGDGVIVRWQGEVRRVDADGDVSSYSRPVDLEPDSDVQPPPHLRPNDRVLQSVAGPGSITLHLVELYGSSREVGGYVRLSETGRRVFLVCWDYGCATRPAEPGARLR